MQGRLSKAIWEAEESQMFWEDTEAKSQRQLRNCVYEGSTVMTVAYAPKAVGSGESTKEKTGHFEAGRQPSPGGSSGTCHEAQPG